MDDPWADIDRLAKQGLLTIDWPSSRILDLGCGGALNQVLPFYADYHFASYVGVDKISKQRIITYELFDLWRRVGVGEYSRLQELDQTQFDQTFKQVYDSDVLSYLEREQLQYDLVILSSLLHLSGLKEVWKSILKHALRVTKTSGYVYVTVFDKEMGFGHFDDYEISEMRSTMAVVCQDIGVGTNRLLRLLAKP